MSITRVAVFVSVVLGCVPCLAGDRNGEQLVQALMDKSGLTKQIEQMPQLMQAELARSQQEAGDLDEEDFNKIRALARSAFDAKAIQASVRTYVKSHLSEDETRAALGWLESPLGSKITRLEEEASTAEAYRDMQSMGPKLLEDNKDTSRLVKMEKLDKAIGATESSVNTALNIQLALIMAMTAAMDTDARPSYDDIRGLVHKNKAQIQAAMKRMVQMHFLYAYRDLTDYELDRYAGFAESKPGRRYHEVTIKAMDGALVQAARKIGSQMGIKMDGI